MDVRRFIRGPYGNEYDLYAVPESMLMQIIIGLQKVQKGYQEDIAKDEFRGEEDQEFLRGEIDAISAFILQTEEYIVVTENGFQIKE